MTPTGISKTLFLAMLTQKKSITDLEPEELDSLLRATIAAHMHGVLANTVDKTLSLLLPLPLSRHFASIHTFSLAQKNQVVASANLLSAQLSSAGIPVLLLKGAAYILSNKPNAQGRLISDIDILVQREALAMVESTLQKNGWRAKSLNDYDEKYYREWSHELPPYIHSETGVILDIHHNLIPLSSGKTINIAQIEATKVVVGNNLYIPSDAYLILHSAIHLLLNDDTEKGLRDCFDLHSLIQGYLASETLDSLRVIFIEANCETEFSILIHLLNRIFNNEYSEIVLNGVHRLSWHDQVLVNSLYRTICPRTDYLLDNKSALARQHVYMHGHLSKMPFLLFIQHICYKGYRSAVKRLLGETFFKSLSPKE
nr:nucleotidyltransferase family protein [uncultured Glaciecola sp.]